MSIYNRRNAARRLPDAQGGAARDRQEAPSTAGAGSRVAAYVGLGLISAGILAGVLAIALRRRHGDAFEDSGIEVENEGSSASTSPRRSPFRRRERRRGARRRVADPSRARGARSVRARQARRGGAARARSRARRQARLERGPVRAVPGCAGGDRARRARAQPLPGRRLLAPQATPSQSATACASSR